MACCALLGLSRIDGLFPGLNSTVILVLPGTNCFSSALVLGLFGDAYLRNIPLPSGLQEAAEIHAGAYASVWGALHRLHGYALHGGVWGALADPDALRDAFQLIPGIQRRPSWFI